MSILIFKSREDFLKKYEKPKTKKFVITCLNVWDSFLRHMQTDEKTILSIMQDEGERYLILAHMVNYWKRNKSPKTIRDYFSFIKKWLRYNNIKIDDEKIKDHITFPKKLKERPVPLDRDKIKMLVENSKPIYKCLWLCLASTGMRVGELLQITISMIDFRIEPVKITIPANLTKTGVERITFLTPEAVRLLKDIIKDKKPEDRVFSFTYWAANRYMDRLRKRLGLNQRTINGKWFHTRIHKFRKFTETTISNSVESEFAHAIIGHEKDRMEYYETPDMEMAEMYKKAIPRLTISDEQRYKDKADVLETKLKENDELRKVVMEQAKRIKRLEDLNRRF
ncbi:hypothetical protein FJZ21_04025 [Candidatus Pacearchaeota archaeon]|nr:hypothetical protein [Candidatus Pacearchaeota archaeon]